jgi:hypothetical protein
VEGDAASGDGRVVVAKDAGEACVLKKVFGVEIFPVIEMDIG